MADAASYIPDFNSVNQRQKQEFQGQIGNVANQQNEYLDRYRGAIGGQEGLGAMAERLGTELGLPQLRKNATTLQTTLENIPTTWNKALTGTDANQSQLDRMIAQKSGELAPVVNKVVNAQNAAEQQLSQRMGYGQADQAKQLLPYQTEQSMLSDRIAQEMTGFNNLQRSELDGLVSKMNAGIQLTQFEETRADQLAQNEKQYELQKQTLGMQQQSAKSSNLINVGGKLYNPQTGQWISPPTTGGGTSGINFGTPSSGSGWSVVPQATTKSATSGFQEIPWLNQAGLSFGSGLSGVNPNIFKMP